MSIVLKNNASDFLAAAIDSSQTTITLDSAASFPTLGAGEYFYGTIESTEGTREIVRVNARVGNTLTVVRGQDGTAAASFAQGSRFESRINVASVEDKIEEEVQELRDDLAADDGSSLVGFTQGNGLARPVESKLRDVLSAKDFGAVGDGVADDTAALQALINSDTGGYLPPGIYRITAPLRFSANRRCAFYGRPGTTNAPRGAQFSPPYTHSIITWDGPVGGVMLDVAQNAYPTPVTESSVIVYIADLLLQGNGTAGIGLYTNGASNRSQFENIMVTGCNLFGVLIGRSWFASYRNISARACSGIGVAIGFNFNGAFDNNDSVNGVDLRDFQVHSCGSTLANNPDVGYDPVTQPWGGCGFYLGRGFTGGTVLDRAQAELCVGNGVVIELASFSAPMGIRDMYLEANGGPYDYYIFGDGNSQRQYPFFIENTFTATAAGVQSTRVFNDSNFNNNVEFIGAYSVINTGPRSVIMNNPTSRSNGSNFTKRIFGGNRVDAKYDDSWVSGTTFLRPTESALLPGPRRFENSSGAKTFDGYSFNLSPTTIETGSAGFAMLVTVNASQYRNGAPSPRYSQTRTYIVNLAMRRRFSTPSVDDYEITVTELGTAAEIGVSTMITDLTVTGVKVSGTQAVLRASYTVADDAFLNNPVAYGPTISWSAIALTHYSQATVTAL